MKIIFSSHYDTGYYLDNRSDNGNDLFNILVTGPMGLLNALERELGLAGNYSEQIKRKLAYREILEDYIDENNSAFYAESFKKDPGGVTNELLKCRDQLIFAGWTSKIPEISTKLDTLREIEKSFDIPLGIEDRWMNIYYKLQDKGNFSLQIREIEIHNPTKNLHPFYGRLFDLLRESGISISLREEVQEDILPVNLSLLHQLVRGEKEHVILDSDDKTTLQIIVFNDPAEIAEFVSCQVPQLRNTVLINSDSCIFDNVQNSFGIPVSGSGYKNTHPQLIQLFKLSASLFLFPLNIHHLLSYLQVDLHPFPARLRYKLLKVISQFGGVNNEHWTKVLDEYDYEENARKKELGEYLYFQKNSGNQIDSQVITRYYDSLETWASQRKRVLDQDDMILFRQLSHLQSLCNALSKILKNLGKAEVTTIELNRMIEEIYESTEILNYRTQKDSVPLITTPGQLYDSPARVIWMDFYNTELLPGFYTFLNQNEVIALQESGCWLWSPEEQARSLLDDMKQGVIRTRGRLTLMYARKTEDKPSHEHPLMSLFRSGVENIEQFIINGSGLFNEDMFEDYGWGRPETEEISNVPLPVKRNSINFLKGSLIPERRIESSSSLETLIQYPFDWVFNYAGQIGQGNTYQLDDVFTTLGNVSHRFVETLFKRSEFNLENATRMLSDFTEIIAEAIEGYGAILLLPENRFNKERMISTMKLSMDNLLRILRENHLRVVSVETKLSETLPSLGNMLTAGYIDLILENSSGVPVIFDLKWTRRDTRYRRKLSEGKHLQLAIYKALLARAFKKEVQAVGYYLLSDAKLITSYPFTGEHVELIESPLSEEEILLLIRNSYDYRFSQFRKGFIEEGEELKLDELDYYNDQEERSLVPLDSQNRDYKKMNYYSAFQAFKGNIY